MSTLRRLGLIVPSSNTTMETEIPRMLNRASVDAEFTFHSSRAQLQEVDAGSLDRMVRDSDRCARELSDAPIDSLAYACLVAVMARGHGAHEEIEEHLAKVAGENGRAVPVTSSAGALVRTLEEMGAKRVAIITPYVPALTEMVIDYLRSYGIDVVDSVSLSVQNNVEVGGLDPAGLAGHADRLDLSGADALVASACVQMPSLSAVEGLEERFELPVITAATATTAELLDTLRLPRRVPGAGSLLWRTDGPPADSRGDAAFQQPPSVEPASTAPVPPTY
jgi:maleate isomerase